MKPKPTIKKNKVTKKWYAFFTDENEEIYVSEGLTSKEALENWYSEFKKTLDLGGG